MKTSSRQLITKRECVCHRNEMNTGEKAARTADFKCYAASRRRAWLNTVGGPTGRSKTMELENGSNHVITSVQ